MADVVSKNLQVNVRFRAWTEEDKKHNNETEYELLTKKALKGIDFVIEDGKLIISKISIGANFNAIFVDFPKHLVMSVGDKITRANGEFYNGMKLKKKLESGKGTKVLLRFEKNPNIKELDIDVERNLVSMNHPENNRHQDFQFDHVFDEANQKTVYESLGRPVIKNILDGFNAAVFMYGQTGSGKTYTMFGKEMMSNDAFRRGEGLSTDSHVGLVPRIISTLFEILTQRESEGMYTEWNVEVTFLEVYRKKLVNLLNTDKNMTPKIRYYDKQLHISNLDPHQPRTAEECLRLVGIAASKRTVSAHNMNASSSRSHMIMTLKLTTKGEYKNNSTLVLADLAGSERVRKAKTSGKSLKEAQSINTQLMHLREAIKNLSQRKRVQWRGSELTQVMKPILMGENCLTSVIVCASKRPVNQLQTWDTLTFAQSAKKIEVSAMKNRKLPREELERKIQELTKEKMDLEEQLKGKAMQMAIEANNEALEAALKRIRELEREIELISANVNQLSIENAQKDELNKELKFRNGELQERIRDLESQVEDVERMEMAVSELESSLGMANHENEELMLKNQELQREINQSKEMRDALTEMTERFASSAKQKSADNDKAFSMLSTLDKLAEAQNHLQDSVREANQKYEVERAEREKLALELARIQAKLEDRDEQLESLNLELEKKEEQFDNLEDRMTQYRREKENADMRIEALTREATVLKKEKASAHKRAQTMAADNLLKVNELMMRENQVEEMKQEAEELKELLEKERQKHREEFLAKQKELERLEEETNKQNDEQLELQEQINNLNDIKTRLIARNESLEVHSEEEKKKLLENLEQIAQDLLAKETDLESANKILETTKAEQQKKDKELETLWVAQRKWDEEKQKLEKEKKEKEEEVMSLEQHLQETKQMLEDTGKQLEDLHEEISEKSNALSDLEKEKAKEREQLEEMELMMNAMRRRQEIMKQQEQQLEASSAEAKQLRARLQVAEDELNVKAAEVTSLKDHLDANEQKTEKLENDLLALHSQQDSANQQRSEIEALQENQRELGNVQNQLENKRLRVAELESGMDVDKRRHLQLSQRIEELELLEGPGIEAELARAKKELRDLTRKMENAELEADQHAIDLDRLERLERKLKEAQRELEKKQEQLRNAWKKQEEYLDQSNAHRDNTVAADHELAKLLQEKWDQERRQKSKVRQSERRNRSSQRKRNRKRQFGSYAAGMHDEYQRGDGSLGGEDLPGTPKGNPFGGIGEGEVWLPEGEQHRQPDRDRKPHSVKQQPPRQHQIGKYKYTNEIRLGEQIRLSRPRPRLKGVVKWIKETKTGYQLGVRLEQKVGNSDGTHGGKRYFDCPHGYGIFCNSSWVSHVLRPNDKTGDLEKIRFENSKPSNDRRKQSNHSDISQYQRTRLRNVLKQNKNLNEIVKNAYRSADTNQDGSIQKEEFRELCVRLRLKVILRNPAFVDDLWQILDVNGDNNMDEEEFSIFIVDFMISDVSTDCFKILRVNSFEEVSNDEVLADCLELCLQKRFNRLYVE